MIVLTHSAGVGQRGHVDGLLLALLIARELVYLVEFVRARRLLLPVRIAYRTLPVEELEVRFGLLILIIVHHFVLCESSVEIQILIGQVDIQILQHLRLAHVCRKCLFKRILGA